MLSLFKFQLLLLLYIILTRSTLSLGELILGEDKAYNAIDFKVPKVVWRQALHPTPVLKSPVTIVVPIHVNQEEDNDFDEEADDVITDDVSVDATLVQEEELVQDPVATINDPSTVASVPETPILEDEPTDEEVAGQVTRYPCSCLSGQCGCCTGAMLERFRMKACGNMSFVPEDFVFDVRLSINNNTVVRRRVSASDPPPICFNPRRAPFVRVCAEISNIRIRNRNAFACLKITGDIAGFPIYAAPFRCFGLGASGVQTGLKPKPVSSGPAPINLFGSTDNNSGGFLQNAANTVLGGGGDGLFGGSGGLFGGGNSQGPLDSVGDAIGDFFGGRNID